MPLCFWATQTVVAASGLFVGANSNSNSNLSCTLPLGLIASGEGKSVNLFLPKKLIGF